MPAATQQSSPPPTARQIETIKRMAKEAGKEIETERLTRAQASEIISSLIGELGETRGNSARNKVEEPVQPKAQVQTPDKNDPFALPGDEPFETGNEPFGGAEGDDDLGLQDAYGESDFEFSRTPDLRNGTFPFVCVRIQRMPPGASGYAFGRAEWKCLDPDLDGAVVFDNISHSPNAAFKRDQLLDALKITGSEKFKLYSQLPGKTAWLSIKLEEYNGRMGPKVDSYVVGPPIEYEPPKAEPKVEATLGAEFA